MRTIILLMFYCISTMSSSAQVVKKNNITNDRHSQNDNDEEVTEVKQVNEIGFEIFADTPWRMKKTDESVNLNGIPIHIFAHEADYYPFNSFYLDPIDIRIKNAADSVFGSPIVFSSYSDSAFNELFSHKSQVDPDIDIQPFDNSLPVKDASSTIVFNSNELSAKFWYFSITIPGDELQGYDNIIDVEVSFSFTNSLGIQSDRYTRMRIFRYDEDLPKLSGWYRGDTHLHSFYTNNLAEFGLPLDATKTAAKLIGLDWITTTDHTSDFDEYGSGIAGNWARIQNEVAVLNAQDASMVYITGQEVHVKNSKNKLVHMVAYPSETDPLGFPFLGDGKGDALATSITIDDVLDSLDKINGFGYGAHPFATADKLSVAVNGGLWNLGDSAFELNGDSFPSIGIVDCNDIAYISDVFSTHPLLIIKPALMGGEIFNVRDRLETSDDAQDPWNVTYNPSTTPFAPLDTNSASHHFSRFRQGQDVIKFINKKSLAAKNADDNMKNWKFYYLAGSDAHGSFNYSNTGDVGGLGSIDDNAIGKLSTLALCPDGMGNNGENVLKALKNGNTILSGGPFIIIGLSTDGNDADNEILIGEDTVLSADQYLNAVLTVTTVTTGEYGEVAEVLLIVTTQTQEYVYNLPLSGTTGTNTYSYNLPDILDSIMGSGNVPIDKYFYFKAEMKTEKDYGSLSDIYKIEKDVFYSMTNPIWVNRSNVSSIEEDGKLAFNIGIFPNPYKDHTNIAYTLNKQTEISIEVYNLLGAKTDEIFKGKQPEGTYSYKYNAKSKGNAAGIYFLKIIIDGHNSTYKMVEF
ncbi:MAG: T9SS type A sorting domain-containing protein [Bacteroidota bacterium]